MTLEGVPIGQIGENRSLGFEVPSRLVTASEAEIYQEAHPQVSDRPADDRGVRLPAWAQPTWLVATAAVAASVALGWIVAVALSANHGFDPTDEAFYLLSYRWWQDSLRTPSDVQFIYGPVFQLLGYDIALLRLFRLATVVVTMLVFGWAFMRWLRLQRPSAPASPLWEVTGVAAIVAAGGLTYGWLPLSPGYNDVSMLGALLAAAVLLRVATHVQAGTRIRIWLACAPGPLAVATLLAKWASAGVTLVVVGAVGLIVLAPRGWRETLRVIAYAVGAALATVLVIQLFMVPLTTALRQMLEVNQHIAAGSNSPATLLDLYFSTSVQLLKRALFGYWPLLAVAVVAVVLRGRRAQIVSAALGFAALAFTGYRIYRTHAFRGGTASLEVYPVALVVLLLTGLLIGLVGLIRRTPATVADASSLTGTKWRGWTMLTMLAILPLTQAAGTGNALYYMAFNCFAPWLALIIAVATGIEGAPIPARGIAAVVVGIAVALPAAIGTSGVLRHPYRTQPYAKTTVAAGVPALDSLKLDRKTAAAYSALYAELRPYVGSPGRAVMAFDEMAGIVLLLDGRSVGEAWYSRRDRPRSAEGIRAECAGGHPWWGDRIPIVIFNRRPSMNETNALASCGLDLEVDYRLLPPLEQSPALRVFVPAKKDSP